MFSVYGLIELVNLLNVVLHALTFYSYIDFNVYDYFQWYPPTSLASVW